MTVESAFAFLGRSLEAEFGVFAGAGHDLGTLDIGAKASPVAEAGVGDHNEGLESPSGLVQGDAQIKHHGHGINAEIVFFLLRFPSGYRLGGSFLAGPLETGSLLEAHGKGACREPGREAMGGHQQRSLQKAQGFKLT